MKLLKVIPNPFTLLDSAGMPAGFTFSDPFHWGANRRFDVVGGRLTKTVDKDGPPAPEDMREVRVVVGAVVSLKPTPVVNSEYHRARILSGEMIAADKESAAECGITEFVDAATLLRAERDARVGEWQADHGGALPPCARLVFEMAGDAVKLSDPAAAPASPKKGAPVALVPKVAAKSPDAAKAPAAGLTPVS